MLICSDPNFPLHESFFARMKNLIVLDMSYMEFVRLPQSFAALENLRSLRLNCNVSDISAIGKLRNLVSLRFYNPSIEVLPKEVGELSNLRLLDLSSCRGLKVIFPGVIQNLSRLEVLAVQGNVLWCDGKEGCSENASLLELNHLSRLMILELYIPDASMLPDDVGLFKNLTKFKVSIGDTDFKTMDIFSLSSQILKLTCRSENELLKPGIKMLMKKAQHLELKDIPGLSVALPSPLGGYRSLKKLIVTHCMDVNYVFDVSESQYEPETISLQQLQLINLPLLKEISKGEIPSLFVNKLEQVKLLGLPTLVRLWQLHAESSLTTMEVTYCHGLEYVFDYISSKNLSKLKELEVKNCRNLQAICLSEGHEDDVIIFPQLIYLDLWVLEKLTSFSSKFCSESILFGEKVIFPALERLCINNVVKLKNIWHVRTQVESFFQLKVLKLDECPELLAVFPLQAISSLRNLEELCIENCDKLETLFQSEGVTVSDEVVLFPRLLTLKLISLPNLTTFLATTSQNIFQAMDQQQLISFPMLKKLPQVISTLPQLRELHLGFIHKSIEWCESLNGCGMFQSLTSLNFFSCNGVKSLVRPSAFSCLLQLQELIISECESMESIIGEASGEQDFEKSIEFSKLCNLKLDNLPRLASFYHGACALKFPCLSVLCIEDCLNLKTLALVPRETSKPSCQNFVFEEALFGQQVSFGRLSRLVLKRLESMEEIWQSGHSAVTVGELVYLGVEGCDRLLKLFPSTLLGGLQKLATLKVESCRSLENVIPVEDRPPLLSNLVELELNDLPELKQLWWNKNPCESFGLENLCYLTIMTCPAIEFVFDPSVANRLENLKILCIENCSSMVEIAVENPGKKIEFPRLETFRLRNLPCFKVKQDVEFPRAQWVVVDRCFDMEERCGVEVKNELAGPVRYFESFVELMKAELDPYSSDRDKDE